MLTSFMKQNLYSRSVCRHCLLSSSTHITTPLFSLFFISSSLSPDHPHSLFVSSFHTLSKKLRCFDTTSEFLFKFP